MKIAKELVEISKVYKDDDMNLTDKYQAVVNSIPYAKLYENIVEVFPDLAGGPDEYVDWNSGTAGWHIALVKTLGKEKVDAIYQDLEWYDSDHLDGAIEARLDQWYKAREKRRERFKAVDKFIENTLLEKDFVFGDTVAEISKRIVEVTPDMIKVEVKVRPRMSVEEIKFELIIE